MNFQRLSQKVIRTMDRVAFHVNPGPEMMREIYRLRYREYLRVGSIEASQSGAMSDGFDHTPNTIHCALTSDDRVVAAIRLHLVSDEYPISPTLEAFPDVEHYFPVTGQRLLDHTRFVTAQGYSRERVGLFLALFRMPFVIAAHARIDTAFLAVSQDHATFYQQFFRFQLDTPPRPYPGLNKPVALLHLNYPGFRDEGFRMYPFFQPERDDFGQIDLSTIAHLFPRAVEPV